MMAVSIKVEHSNIQETCRTCATHFNESILIPVFDRIEITTKTNTEFQLANELLSLDVQIAKDDGLPQQVCIDCVKQLTNIHAFRLKCKEAQEKFKKLLLNNNTFSCLIDGIDEKRSEMPLPSIDDVQNVQYKEYVTTNDTDDEEFKNFKTDVSLLLNVDVDQTAEILQYQIEKEEPALTVTHIDNQEFNYLNNLVGDGMQDESEEKELIDQINVEIEDGNVPLNESNKVNLGYWDDFTFKDIEHNNYELKVHSSSENKTETKTNRERKQQRESQRCQEELSNEQANNSRSIAEEKFDSIKLCLDCHKYVHSSRYKIDGRECSMLQQSNELQIPSDSEFCCFYCDEKFESIETIQDHILKLHSIKNPFQCKMCNEYFPNIRKRRLHFKKAHSQPRQQENEINQKTEPIPHKNAKNQEIYKCDVDNCNKEYKVHHFYRIHKLRVHPDRNYECSFCFMKFTNLYKFNHHLKSHDKSKQIKCKFCDKTFLRQSLLYHEETHTNADKPHKCDDCGKSFIHRSMYNIHTKAHIQSRSFQCEYCGKRFNTKRNLRAHHLIHLESGDKYERFKIRKNLYKARAKKHVEHKKFYTCPISGCKKQFHLPSALKRHMKLHDKNRKHKCDICRTSYRTSDHLKLHVNRVHSKSKYYDCTICKKRFYELCRLNVHVRSHEKYKCSYCNKEYSKVYIKHHERTHTQEKKELCLICGKSFILAGRLLTHHRTHTAEEIKEMEAKIVADNKNLIKNKHKKKIPQKNKEEG